MIARLIHWSIHNRFLVLLASIMLAAWGAYSTLTTPLDALPDLSDTQVIIRTTYPGQAPQVVEDQVTYPLTTTMLSVPFAKTVRGYSLFGESFVYVLFEDGTDLYWARSRVLEYLSQVQGRLPANARTALGPDATGVGWIYEYALIDRTGKNDISQLRALQDWFLKYELKTVPNVAEVATLGGFNKQYQIVLDPSRLRAFKLPVETVMKAVQDANGETGGSENARRLPCHPGRARRKRNADPAARRGDHPARPRNPARYRRTGWRRRSGGRRHRAAFRHQCREHHCGGEGKTRNPQGQPA